MTSSRRPLALLIAVIAILATPLSSDAAVVMVGSPIKGLFSPTVLASVPCTCANSALPEPGAHAVSPIDGTVIRWHLLLATGGAFKLRVLHPAGGEAFLGSGTSAPEVPTGPKLQTFSTALAIRTGDLIGLENTESTQEIGVITPPGSKAAIWAPPLADGASALPIIEVPAEIAYNAEVQPLPTITGFGASSGSVSGGTVVTIVGTDLENLIAVEFGGVPSANVTAGSETSVTAIVPPGSALGPVPVAVRTLAGSAVSSQAFSYEGCLVPKLRGRSLKASKRKVRAAGCKLGKPGRRKGVTAKTGKVVKQIPKAGTVLGPASKLRVVLGRR